MKTRSSDSSLRDRSNGPSIRSDTAILLIDVVNDFAFEDGDKLWKNARSIVQPIVQLRSEARSSGIPVIYVNDNFGHWKEDLQRQIDRILDTSSKGREFLEQILPDEDDYYVLKPQRSGFYKTPLAVLLSSMEVSSLVIAGITTDICVLFTAHDAYMRGFRVSVPSDCTAAVEDRYKNDSLSLMERVAGVEVGECASLSFARAAREEKK